MSENNKVYQEGANAKAARGLSKIMAVLIILIVAAFGDIMYIVKMQQRFPGGIFLVLCYIGAFMSFAAIGYLLLGKTTVFRPGAQLLTAWVVFGTELVIIGLNILLVFSNSSDSFMVAWAYVSPATPVLHMIGVALIFFLDPDLKEKHEDMELQSKINGVERQYKFAVHEASMGLKFKQLGYTVKALESAVNSQESLEYIEQFGADLNGALLTELTGRAIPRAQRLAAPGSIRPVGAGEREQLEERAVAQTADVGQERPGFLDRAKAILGGSQGGGAPQQPAAAPEPASIPVQPAAAPMPQVVRRPPHVHRRRTNGFMPSQPAAAPVSPTPQPQPLAQSTGNGEPQAKNGRSPRKKKGGTDTSGDGSTMTQP